MTLAHLGRLLCRSFMDPNPLKHSGSLKRLLQANLEPVLHACGFVLIATSRPSPEKFSIDYLRSSHPQILLSISTHNDGQLVADAVIDPADYLIVARSRPASRTTPELMFALDEFHFSVRQFVNHLPKAKAAT